MPDDDDLRLRPAYDHQMFGYEACKKLIRYGSYSESREDALVSAYLQDVPDSIILRSLKDGDEYTSNPRNEFAVEARVAIRHGFFLRLIAHTESALKEYATRLCELRDLPLRANEIRADGLSRYRKYLEIFGTVDFTDVDGYWKFLDYLYLIRHCWAHADGIVERSQLKKLRVFQKETNLITISDDGQTVTIEAALISEASGVILRILHHIADSFETMDKSGGQTSGSSQRDD